MRTYEPAKDRAAERYLAEMRRTRPLTREQEMELARRYRREGEVSAGDELVKANLPAVVPIALRYRGCGTALMDIIQEGNLGLLEAVRRFDPERGCRLRTYAVWWIRAYIRGLVLRDWSIVAMGGGRVSRRLFSGLRSARAKLECTHGRLESDEPLAAELGVSPRQVSEMSARLEARDGSLDALRSEDGSPGVDSLAAACVSPEERVIREEGRQVVQAALATLSCDLSEREQVLLAERLLSDQPKTLAALSREFRVSRERMRQVEAKLLKRLREVMEADGTTNMLAA